MKKIVHVTRLAKPSCQQHLSHTKTLSYVLVLSQVQGMLIKESLQHTVRKNAK